MRKAALRDTFTARWRLGSNFSEGLSRRPRNARLWRLRRPGGSRTAPTRGNPAIDRATVPVAPACVSFWVGNQPSADGRAVLQIPPQAMPSGIAGGVGHGRRVLKISRHLKRETVPKDENFRQKRIFSPSTHKQCAALQGVWGNWFPHKNLLCAACVCFGSHVEVVEVDIGAGGGVVDVMLVESYFEENAQLCVFGGDVLPVFKEVGARVGAEVCPGADLGGIAGGIFDEEVLCIADGERWCGDAGDDVAQLCLSLVLSEVVGTVDDDELEILFPVAACPVFDVVEAFDAFWDVVGEDGFLNPAPDDGGAFVA